MTKMLHKQTSILAMFAIVASLFTGGVLSATTALPSTPASANSGNVGGEGNESPSTLVAEINDYAAQGGHTGSVDVGGGGSIGGGNTAPGNTNNLLLTKTVIKYCPELDSSNSCQNSFATVDKEYARNLAGEAVTTRNVRINGQLASFNQGVQRFKDTLITSYDPFVTVSELSTCSFIIPNGHLVINPVSSTNINNYRSVATQIETMGGLNPILMAQFANIRATVTGSVQGWITRSATSITTNPPACNGFAVTNDRTISWDHSTAMLYENGYLFHRAHTCPTLTDGREFPYPVAMKATYKDTTRNATGARLPVNIVGIVTHDGHNRDFPIWRSGSVANVHSWTHNPTPTVPSTEYRYRGSVWTLENNNITCIYVPNTPDGPKPPKVSYTYTATCFWDPSWSGAHSTNLAAIQSGGNAVPATLIPGRNVATVGPNINAVSGATMKSLIDSQRYSYNSLRNNTGAVYNMWNNRGVDCFNSINDSARLTMQDYGYYRLTGEYDSRTVTIRFDFWSTAFTGGRVVVVPDSFTATQSPVTVRNVHQYGIYACDFDNGSGSPYGKWNTYGELQSNGQGYTFDYSACPNVTPPICVISDSPVVSDVFGVARSNSEAANRLNAIGYNIPNSDGMIVMRDGTKYGMLLPSVNVITDSSTVRGSGPGGAVVDGDLQYRVSVGEDVSPYNKAVGVNHSQQYFAMFNSTGDIREPFNTWLNNPNANRNKHVAWYWSTDTDVEGWGADYNLRLHNVNFYVPVIAYSNSNSVSYEWRVDDYNCSLVPAADTSVNLGFGAGFGGIQVVRSVNEQR